MLDPRVAYVMTDMMEGVINNGLGFSAVRARGFQQPAAGKTGSSHDGWFAGYTSNLLCIVWVGFDDYSEIHLTGAQTAAPIWTEFMKKASHAAPIFQHASVLAAFGRGGRSTRQSHQSAGNPGVSANLYLGIHRGDRADQHLRPGRAASRERFHGFSDLGNQQAEPPQNGQPGEKKKGLMGKFAGIFKDDKPSNSVPKPPDASGASH